MLAVYQAFDARAVVPGLTAYWAAYYLPTAHGLHASITFVTSHVSAISGDFGLGPVWLAVPLVIAGLVTLARLGRPATAIAAAALWPEMLALSALKRYPFGDLRTSTFLIAITVVVAAIGVAGVGSLLRPWLHGTLAAGLAAGVAAAAVVAFAVGAQPFLRGHPIPHEDVRDQARYVAAQAAPGDVVLVNLNSNWGFAYYWPRGQPARRADAAVLQGYEAYFPRQRRIIVAGSRDAAGVNAALSQALARSPAGPSSCTRIWLVRTHLTPPEQAVWVAALRLHRVFSAPAGPGGLSVVQVGGAACQPAG
jgi:hypothetical protein